VVTRARKGGGEQIIKESSHPGNRGGRTLTVLDLVAGVKGEPIETPQEGVTTDGDRTTREELGVKGGRAEGGENKRFAEKKPRPKRTRKRKGIDQVITKMGSAEGEPA